MDKIDKLGQEQKFVKWFMGYHGKEFTSVTKEICLYPAYSLLDYRVRQAILYGGEEKKTHPIGRIDLGFIYHGKKYLCEVKYYPFTNYEFWDSLKILGYVQYYQWQVDEKYYPAIMIPINKFKLESAIVASKLEITVFGIKKRGDEYEIVLLKAPLPENR